MNLTRFPAAIAARFFGLTVPTFGKLSLSAEPFCRHRRYSRAVLEQAPGRPITGEMIAEAEALAAPCRVKARDAARGRKEAASA